MLRKFLFILFFFVGVALQAQPLWMRYSAISPDGDKIAFSYQDDIFIVSSTGGEATAVTRHQAHDFMPVWSRDGENLAFASYRYGNYDVFLYNLKSGKVKRLTKHSANDFPSDFAVDGSHILFTSVRLDDPKNAQFPYRRLGELYSINTEGTELKQVFSLSAQKARYSIDGKKILFQNKVGYEDEWRKHHQSAVTRDIMAYDLNTGSFDYLTDFKGEDRNPVPSHTKNGFYFLSEGSGSFNIWYQDFDGSNKKQLTKYSKHPVRFLSIAKNGVLCYGYDGEIYTLQNEQSTKLNVQLKVGEKSNQSYTAALPTKVSEMAVSPNGKEVAFIVRGDVFVTSVEYKETKQITETPYQERSVSFSPDGKKILYAAEKDESWGVFTTEIVQEKENHFFNATQLLEKTVIHNDKENFQPAFSPNGEEVAFLEERTTLKVIDTEKQKVRTILPAKYNYSYSDGDQHYAWSPDGNWFLVDFNDTNRWMGEAGLIAADGSGELMNLTQSGYSESGVKWMMSGNLALFMSDRYGMRSHGSWGAQSDVLGVFLNEAAFGEYKKPLSESVEEDSEDDEKQKEKNIKPINVEREGLQDRKVRLSLHSAYLAGAVTDKKARNLYYLARFEKGFDLWKYDMKKRKAEVISKLSGGAGSLQLSHDEKFIFLISGGKMLKIQLSNGEKKPIDFKGHRQFNFAAERDYLFEHLWRQTLKKFYVEDMHGVDWQFYKEEYQKFLPHINNNHDFSEMASELLGELNASHTGCRYFPKTEHADKTASLGVFIDYAYEGEGLKVSAVLENGPADRNEVEIKAGDVIKAINGVKIKNLPHFFTLLNHKAGKKLLLSIDNEKGKDEDVYITAISSGAQSNLLYERWVDSRNERVEELSDGKLGYVHIRGMNDGSFREVYQDLLGKHSGKEGIIIDSRFNGGGWLHDDLATLFSGERYVDFVPRGQFIGSDPHEKWNKSSCLLVGEGNYPDAHGFPYVYQTLGIGKVIGMPVPGTMTAVWWETLQDPTLVFGIPQVGCVDMDGNYLENQQLEPDIKVNNEFAALLQGEDLQLQAAVKHLLNK